MADESEALEGRAFINGQWTAAASGAWSDVRDPSTGQSFGRVARGNRDDARAAGDAAAAAQERWAGTPAHERARWIRDLADRIEADRDGFARLIAREVGKPIQDARVEVTRAIGVYRMAAEEARQLTGESYPADAYPYPPGNEHRFLFTVREPVGVVVAISPFNFPLNLLSHKIAPALAAGNAVVAKPASAGALTALRLAQVAEAAGLPPGVLNVVPGPGGAVADALIEHPATRLVTFTGSTAVGKAIAERAGRHAKRVLLEMGGLDPIVVLDDAPIDVAVSAAARGAFAFSGQVCTASKRVLVAAPIAAEFGRRLAETARGLRLGPALEEETQVGPVADPASLERLDRLVADARGRSAQVLAGGERAPEIGGGWFYRPTVLDGVGPDAQVAREEPFGPIAPMLRFGDLDEAIRIANATEYGLQAAIYTRDLRAAFRFARGVRAGGVHINDPTTLRWDALPFGGVKESGIGREGLRSAMQEMTDVKLVSVNFG